MKFGLFTLSGLKVKDGEFRVEFVRVCEWFDRCDRLKIIFKSRKKKITKLSSILKIIKNYYLQVWFVVEKISKCINQNNIFF